MCSLHRPSEGPCVGTEPRRIRPSTGRTGRTGGDRRAVVAAAVLVLLFALSPLAPAPAHADLVFYDPDLDISMGMLAYDIPGLQVLPENMRVHTQPGPFVGGYFSLQNPLLVNYLHIHNLYNIVEAGIAVNRYERGPETGLLLSFPVAVDFAYRIRLGERFSLLPFVGTGVTLLKVYDSEDPLRVYPLVKTGLELRYRTAGGSSLKLKLDYGIMFVDDLEEVPEGYMQFLRVRLPVPFIP